MINFTSLVGRGDNLRYKMDILGPGEIGIYLFYINFTCPNYDIIIIIK